MENNLQETTSFGYKGMVNLKLKIKDKVINISQHNTGTNYLFKSIYKFLTGNYEKPDIPTYLDLREEVQNTWISRLNTDIRLSAGNYTDSQASVNGIIRFDNIIGTSISSGTFRLYLMSDYNSQSVRQDLAYISISAEDLSKITAGINLIVEWVMTVTNAPSAPSA